MLAVALSLAASCSWGVADFAGGLFSRRWPAVAVLFVVETAGLLTAGIIVVASADAFPDARSALLGLVAGTAGITGLGLFFTALSVGSMSIVAPLASTGAVVPVAVGVATGDRITVVIGIGLAIALAGIALAAQEGGEESGAVAGHHGRSVALAFAAALAFGTFFVAYDGAADGSVSWAILLARVPAIPLAGGLMVVAAHPAPSRGPDLLKVGVAPHSSTARRRRSTRRRDARRAQRRRGGRLAVPGGHRAAGPRRARRAPADGAGGRRPGGAGGRGAGERRKRLSAELVCALCHSRVAFCYLHFDSMSTTLSDGTRVVLRPDRAAGRAGAGRGARAAVAGVGPRPLLHRQAALHRRRSCATSPRSTWSTTCALVAALEDEPDGLVAVGRFVRNRTAGRSDSAEIAVTVCDALQGRGLGRALGLALADHARARGIPRFTATMLPENTAALALFRTISAALHQKVHIEVHHGVRELVTDLAA